MTQNSPVSVTGLTVAPFNGAFDSRKYDELNYRQLQLVDAQVIEIVLRQQAELEIPSESIERFGIIGSAAVLLVPMMFERLRATYGRYDLIDPTDSNLLLLGERLGFTDDPILRAMHPEDPNAIYRKFEVRIFRKIREIFGDEEAERCLNALQKVQDHSRGIDGDINTLRQALHLLMSVVYDYLVESYVAYAITESEDEVLYSWKQMLRAVKVGGYVTSISFLNSSGVYPAGKEEEGIGCPATPITREFILNFLNLLAKAGYIRYVYGETQLDGEGMPREGAEEAAVWTAQLLKPLPED
ncbi:hypothetical protein [Seinonella peptonophila]|uniref:hypothetical protein n=1 Tax=Seinonella peptonophila TaxID=112248 RepID=UPI001114B5E7|nr:hypothetical protein [Seinonella peptonophila]